MMDTDDKYEVYFCQRCGRRFVDTAKLSTLQINPKPILCWKCRKTLKSFLKEENK